MMPLCTSATRRPLRVRVRVSVLVRRLAVRGPARVADPRAAPGERAVARAECSSSVPRRPARLRTRAMPPSCDRRPRQRAVVAAVLEDRRPSTRPSRTGPVARMAPTIPHIPQRSRASRTMNRPAASEVLEGAGLAGLEELRRFTFGSHLRFPGPDAWPSPMSG